MARQRRLKKDLVSEDGKLGIEVIGGTGIKFYDPNELPTEVQEKLPVLALSHKLGDAASGLDDPTFIEETIEKVWNAMLAGEWTTRKPGQPKIALKDIKDNLDSLTDEEKEAARVLLKTLGIAI